MKKRLITGISGALFAISLLVFMQYPFVIGIPLAFFATVSVHEIMHVIKCENKVLTAVAMVFTAIVPLYTDIKHYLVYHRGSTFFDNIKLPLWAVLTVYIFLIMILMLRNYEKTKFEQAAMAIFSSIALAFGYTSMIYLRDIDHMWPEYFQQSHGLFVTLSAMLCAWLSDTFAYFFGRKLGKHKLAPVISPKKSVEGAIAGVLGNTLVVVIVYLVASHYFDRLPDSITLIKVIPACMAVTVMGMCGDLSASVIKRNFGAKDYGTFFPGHGGVMDRFDSFLFTLPTTYLIITMVMTFIA